MDILSYIFHFIYSVFQSSSILRSLPSKKNASPKQVGDKRDAGKWNLIEKFRDNAIISTSLFIYMFSYVT